MSQKKIWSIDRMYKSSFIDCAGKMRETVEADPFDTIEATEEEIHDILHGNWNPPCLEDEFGTVYRKYEANELTLRTIDDLKDSLEAIKAMDSIYE